MPILEVAFGLILATACLAALMWVTSHCAVWILTTYYDLRNRNSNTES